MLSTSPERGVWQIACLEERLSQGKTTETHVQEMQELYQTWRQQQLDREQDPEWQQNNLEYDLRSCDWIIAKVRGNESYAQNLYAAMCNRNFRQNQVWPQLKNQTWSCSWRYAGGIVADMRGQGDYIDWYCSGIRGDVGIEGPDPFPDYVSEGHVTDQIRQDLFSLGWLVLDDDHDIDL